MSWPCLIFAVLFTQSLLAEPPVVLPKRFAIPVRTDRNFDPSHLEVGMAVKLIISQDLRWRGCLVFREGNLVTATVSEVRNPGAAGRSSLVVLDINSAVAVDGTIIPLSGSIRAEGEDRTMESIGAAAGVCCLAIFIPGGRQSIGKGVGTIAFTTTEMEVRCAGD